jgi:hypothetical protein
MTFGKAAHWTEDERQQKSKHHGDKKGASVGQCGDEQDQEHAYIPVAGDQCPCWVHRTRNYRRATCCNRFGIYEAVCGLINAIVLTPEDGELICRLVPLSANCVTVGGLSLSTTRSNGIVKATRLDAVRCGP